MNKGFTLIELLVVVLIIGILSAVALPQYEKSVMKARNAEALTILKKMGDNMEMYILSGGSRADFSCEAAFEGYPDGEKNCSFSTKNFDIVRVFDMPVAAEKNGNYGLLLVPSAATAWGVNASEVGRWCSPSTDKGTAFCKSLSGKSPQSIELTSTAYPF